MCETKPKEWLITIFHNNEEKGNEMTNCIEMKVGRYT